MGLSALFGRTPTGDDAKETQSAYRREGIRLMTTERQVDYLFWAVAEARRLRAEEEKARGVRVDLRPAEPWLRDGFVTEWQSPESVGLTL